MPPAFFISFSIILHHEEAAMAKKNYLPSFLLILALYAAAFAAGYFILTLFPRDTLLGTFAGDVAATLIVWAAGLIAKNASLYDPYWSVAPLAVIPLWTALRGTPVTLPDIFYITAIGLWGLRLTVNWAVRWRGIAHQDWRYTMLRDQRPKMWLVTNLWGINLMPTLIVFACMIPAYLAITYGTAMNALGWVGFAVCIAAALIQLVSDIQMELFRKKHPDRGANMDKGLWRYSRHPNYFGEVSLWWGVWLMQMGIVPQYWYTVAAPILMSLLFIFISIPMMEKHTAKREGFAEYKKKVSMLVPWPRKG
jgi:steroid 5-alpha reductase family enzyme